MDSGKGEKQLPPGIKPHRCVVHVFGVLCFVYCVFCFVCCICVSLCVLRFVEMCHTNVCVEICGDVSHRGLCVC